MIVKKDLGNNSYFIGESFNIGENFSIGSNNIIKVRHFNCKDNVTIGSNNKFLVADTLTFGSCTYVGNNNDVTGINAKFGDYLYFDSNVIIGHGGKMNYDSEIYIGEGCMICSYVKLNINYRIDIGDNVGIGEYVDVWTHGSFPPVLDGFPSQFGRVKIGSHVWLPAKSTVMPGIEIGDNIVIGANSIINKNLPSGSLCAGMPVKIIKENMYPKVLPFEERLQIIKEALKEYEKLKKFKKLDFKGVLDETELVIKTKSGIFNFQLMKVLGNLSDEDEDFRDFLRRRGMKFFTGKPFSSIIPTIYQDLINYEG